MRSMSTRRCPLSSPLLGLCLVGAITALAGGCHKSGSASSGGSSEDSPTIRQSAPAATLSAQQLYESKRYAEAKAKSLDEANSLSGHDREVALLTAGLSAHALQQYDDATTLLSPLTRSDDSRIAGRAKTALDYIGIERGRKSVIGTPLHPATTKLAASAIGTVPANPPPPGARGYALQAGVFTSIANAKNRAAQLRVQSVQTGLGEPRVVPDKISGRPAWAVMIGSFVTKQAANDAKSRFAGQMVVTAAP